MEEIVAVLESTVTTKFNYDLHDEHSPISQSNETFFSLETRVSQQSHAVWSESISISKPLLCSVSYALANTSRDSGTFSLLLEQPRNPPETRKLFLWQQLISAPRCEWRLCLNLSRKSRHSLIHPLSLCMIFFCLSFLCMVPSCFWLVCILWTPIVDLKIKEKYLIRKFGGIGVKEDSVLTVTKIGKARCIKYLKLQVSFWEEAGNVIEPVTVSTMVEGGMEMSIFEYLDWVERYTIFW